MPMGWAPPSFGSSPGIRWCISSATRLAFLVTDCTLSSSYSSLSSPDERSRQMASQSFMVSGDFRYGYGILTENARPYTSTDDPLPHTDVESVPRITAEDGATSANAMATTSFSV